MRLWLLLGMLSTLPVLNAAVASTQNSQILSPVVNSTLEHGRG